MTQATFGIGEPSVAQPPLPLQLFFCLQPLSLDLQPPWPLQSFWPLQECLGGLSALVRRSPAFAALTLAPLEPLVAAWAATEVPPIRPESAAVRSNAFSLFFIDDLAGG
jgi:hypothetical protein